MTESTKSLSALTTNVMSRALETSGTQDNQTQEKTDNLNAVWNTHYIYSITVLELSEKHPNEISQRIIMSAMLAQERFRHAEHLLAYISSDILLIFSVWF